MLKWPSSATEASEEARRTLRYVEPLSEARIKLADFFSILRGPTAGLVLLLLGVTKGMYSLRMCKEAWPFL